MQDNDHHADADHHTPSPQESATQTATKGSFKQSLAGKGIYWKLLIVGLLFLLLAIPQSMINGLISERAHWRDTASHNVAQSWPAEQRLVGPILVVPYQYQETVREWDKNKEEYLLRNITRQKKLFVMPDLLNVSTELNSSERSLGIYKIPVYAAELDFSGRFSTTAIRALRNKQDNITDWGEPYVAVMISDMRGVSSQPVLKWGTGNYEFIANTAIENMASGMRAVLPKWESDAATTFDFRFSFHLKGLNAIQYSLVGKGAELNVHSNWQHPSFVGTLLPEERTVSEEGFSALWRASAFSNDTQAALDQCSQEADCSLLVNNTVGVRLIKPVDAYLLSERSVKYAQLFVLLTFVGFVLFEMLKRLPIHPVQYMFVGSALTVFYLLLVSLSEHISFSYSYLTSTLACSLLITLYLTAAFKRLKIALFFGGGFIALYGMLYVILQSEDHALLMGSLLIFAVLAILMIGTRHINWYALGGTAIDESLADEKQQNKT